jgi:hypothetical protein
MAWWPSPLGIRSGAERASSRGGTVGAGSLAASSGQGFHVECRCGEGEMPGKEGASGPHRGRRSMVRRHKWLRVVAFNGGRGPPVAGGDGGVVLQLRGGREG